MSMEQLLRETRSVCPVCLRNLPAQLLRQVDGKVILQKTCPAHGTTRVTVWQGSRDFADWCAAAPPLAPGAGLD